MLQNRSARAAAWREGNLESGVGGGERRELCAPEERVGGSARVRERSLSLSLSPAFSSSSGAGPPAREPRARDRLTSNRRATLDVCGARSLARWLPLSEPEMAHRQPLPRRASSSSWTGVDRRSRGRRRSHCVASSPRQ